MKKFSIRRNSFRKKIYLTFSFIFILSAISCPQPTLQSAMKADAKVIFLHHSTGGLVWNAGVVNEISLRNANLGTNYSVSERSYPNTPWPWENYPSDYYRLWVGGEGSNTNESIQTLDALCAQYDVIVWKHCYPVTEIEADIGVANPASSTKTLANYKAAYNALKTKMQSFKNKRFIVWTGAVEQSGNCTQEQAQRLKDFRDWIITTWDQTGDNIFVFDFWYLETEGGLYLKSNYAASSGDDHPNAVFCTATASKFAERIVDVLQGRGDVDPRTGL